MLKVPLFTARKDPMRPTSALFLRFLLVCQTIVIPSLAQQTKPSAPGKMIDIGGYSLYLNCSGQGAPTVILEYGLGDVSSVWALVQRQVAKSVRVCSYDRAYDGFSDGGPVPVTLHQQVSELHALLKAAHIEPPYVLVGQSAGGLLNQLYKSLYPQDVAGMVLVDSTHLDTGSPNPLRSSAKGRPIPPARTMSEAPPPPLTNTEQENLDKALAQLSKESAGPLSPPRDQIPLEIQPIYRWEHSHPKMPPGSGAHPFAWWAEEMQQMFVDRQGKEHIYGDMPLIVLAASRASTDQERLRQVNDMVGMSTNSMLIVDAQGHHDLQLSAPGLVSWSIERVVEAVQTHGRVDILKP
jgi:pimeloyl-ACP methyl ester carboxylesterase